MSVLTAELLQQQEALQSLTPEQVEATVKLANNIFKKEFDDAHGVWHRRWEEDIKALTGKTEKPQGIKSHEWLKQEWAEREAAYKKQLDEAQKGDNQEAIEKANREIKRLQDELKDAGLKGSELLKQDIEGYKKRLSDYETLVEELKKQGQSERKTLETKIQEMQRNNLHLEVGFEKAQSLAGVEFDPYVDASIRDTFIESRWSAILNKYTPEKSTNAKGEIVTQWRDKDGKLALNPTNGMEPYTTKDLLMQDLQPILKKGRQQAGAGTNGGQNVGNGAYLDLRGAKTQVEADEKIAEHLLAKGMQRGTAAFSQEQSKIRTENKVAELPIQ